MEKLNILFPNIDFMTNDCPFIPGKRYKILKDIDELGNVFLRNEIVVFKNTAYDAHNGLSRFWFIKQRSHDEMSVWHVWDTDLPASEQWHIYFQECD